MNEEIKRKLRAIQEGAILEDASDDADDLDDLDLDDLDEDLIAEATLALLEAELGPEAMPSFMAENATMLVRDKLLTEDVAGKSYIVLSPEARRQKAINIMKLNMAKSAGDPRYKKLVLARAMVKKLLEGIRGDSRYAKAEAIVRKQHFTIVSNPEAVAAMNRSKKLKLQ